MSVLADTRCRQIHPSSPWGLCGQGRRPPSVNLVLNMIELRLVYGQANVQTHDTTPVELPGGQQDGSPPLTHVTHNPLLSRVGSDGEDEEVCPPPLLQWHAWPPCIELYTSPWRIVSGRGHPSSYSARRLDEVCITKEAVALRSSMRHRATLPITLPGTVVLTM